MPRRSRNRSRSARNQARNAEHRAMQGGAVGAKRQSPTLSGPEPVGSNASIMNSGSIQASPARIKVGGGNAQLGIASPDPSGRTGIKLQPFRDFMPQGGDWTDHTTQHMAHTGGGGSIKVDWVSQSKQVWVRDEETGALVGRVWEALSHDREKLDAERAGKRDTHESAMMAADRPSGVAGIMTGTGDDEGARHEDDLAAKLYRDELGRIVRTEDMEEYADRIVDLTSGETAWRKSDPVSLTCEIDEETSRVRILEVNGRTGERRRRGQEVIRPVDSTMTTGDYATMHGVPLQRNATQRAHAAGKARAEKTAAKQAEREAKAAARAAAKADSPQRVAAPGTSRSEIDEAAKAMLARMGVTSPTREHMRLAREAVVHKRQVADYTGA